MQNNKAILFAFMIEAVLTLLCIAIIAPPLNRMMLIAAVVAIELSAYLFVVGIAVLVIVWRVRGPLRIPAISLAVLDLVVCALPAAFMMHSGVALRLPAPAAKASDIIEFAIPVQLGDDRTSIHAYLPRSGQKNPIVFAIYGGAWQWGTPDNDSWINRTLASDGYAVFALDYRHAPANRFPAALDDVRSEMNFIIDRAAMYRADTQRMAVIGHSSGGQLAELSVFAPHSPFRALVSYSGGVDLAMGYEVPPSPDPINVPSLILAFMGDTPANVPAQYRAASPVDNVRCGSPPTLLIYGSRDHVVDFRSALRLRDALRDCGNDVTLLELPWTEHGFEDVPYGLHAPVAFEATEAFLERTLRGR
jgi:acetyl esterase/lipase